MIVTIITPYSQHFTD